MGVSDQKVSSSGSCSWGGTPLAFSFLPKNRASSPCLLSGCSEDRVGLIISSGTWATLVVKNVLNFSFCFCSISSRVSSRRSESFGILVPPIARLSGPGYWFVPARWAWIS